MAGQIDAKIGNEAHTFFETDTLSEMCGVAQGMNVDQRMSCSPG